MAAGQSIHSGKIQLHGNSRHTIQHDRAGRLFYHDPEDQILSAHNLPCKRTRRHVHIGKNARQAHGPIERGLWVKYQDSIADGRRL